MLLRKAAIAQSALTKYSIERHTDRQSNYTPLQDANKQKSHRIKKKYNEKIALNSNAQYYLQKQKKSK